MQASTDASAWDGGAGRLRPTGPPRALPASSAESEQRGLKRSTFENRALAYLLLAPQMIVLLFFFFIPSFRALIQAFQLSDPFGGSTQWVGLDNLAALWRSAPYWAAVRATIVFTLALSVATLGVALLLAFAAHHVLRGQTLYKTFILVPYAVAPAIAGIVWAFLFNPAVGPIAHLLHSAGIAWDPNRFPGHAAINPRSCGGRRCRSHPSLRLDLPLDAHADAVLPRGDQFRLRLLRHLRRHRCDDPWRAGGRHHDHGLQGLSGWLRLARPRLLRRAVDRPDGARPGADLRAVPVSRSARPLRGLRHG